MEVVALTAYALAIFSLAIKPGPGVLAVISRSAENGFTGFLTYMSGAILGELIYLATVLLGFSFFEEQLLFFSILLKALASAYLIYLGFQILIKPPEIDFEDHKRVAVNKGFKDFSTGLVLTLSNPFVIIVFGGIVPDVIGNQGLNFTTFIALAFVTTLIQLSVDFMYCAPVLMGRRFMKGKAIRKLALFSGVLMIVIGLYLGYTALPALDLKTVL